MTHIKPPDMAIGRWLRLIAKDVWMRDWPDNWWRWESIREE